MRCRLLASVTGALVTALACSGGGSTEAFCETARALATDNPAAAFGAYEPSDPAASRDQLEGGAEQLRQLARDAPDEISNDVDRLADAAEGLAQALSVEDPEAVERALRDLEPDLAGVDEASRRVIDFAATRCEVDLDPTTTTIPPG